jgi:hypothetical protein
MTKEEATAWREGWRMLAAFEREELRRISPETKLERTAALMASARDLGWLGTRRDDDQQVWERWRRLKEHHDHHA